MHKSKILLVLLLSFLGGIFFRSFWSIDLAVLWLVFIMAVAIIIVDYKNKKSLIFGLVGILFLLGVSRLEIDLKKVREIQIPRGNLEAQVKIIKEPEKKEYFQNLTVEVSGRDLLKNNSAEKFRMLVKTELYRDFSYGEKIKLSCAPEIVKNFSPDFDYKMYLAKDKIYYSCAKANIEKISKKELGFFGFILEIRKKLETNVNRIIPEPEAALANGLLFGGGNRLSKEMQDTFSKTGMSHIVAVSGYNVTIIVAYLMILGIFLGLWRAQAFYFAILGIFIFVAMIGFPSSAVRAGVMGSLILWAIKNGRLASLDNSILLAGSIMLAINPLSLRWDIGFQLSFLATIGLIKTAPLWKEYLLKKYGALGFIEIILMTVGAQIFVLPIILYNFHNLALTSLIANVLVLPIIPLTMLFIFVSAIAGFVLQPVALVAGWLAWGLLRYEIGIIEFLASFGWANFTINNFNQIWAFAWYGIIVLGLYFFNKKNTTKAI